MLIQVLIRQCGNTKYIYRLLRNHRSGQMADDSEAVEWWHEMARLVAAFFAVFTMCTDDLLWFMPFAISPRKYTFCVWYLIFMEITVLLSWALVGLVAYA